MDIIEQDSRKPDPDDPWRYVCPECQAQVQGTKSVDVFRCHSCETTYPFSDLYDQKHREIVGDRRPR